MDLYPIFLPAPHRGQKPTVHRSYVRRHLLTTLSRHLGRKISDSDLCVSIHGKPSLRSGEVSFNLSHSGNWLYVLLADAAVGVDIEHFKPHRSSQTLRDFLSLKCDGPLSVHDDQAIARIWSRLEALTKCSGLGMTVSLDHIRVPAEPASLPAPLSTPLGHHWLVDLPAAASYCATAVSAYKPTRIRVFASLDTCTRLKCPPDADELTRCSEAREMSFTPFFASSSVRLRYVRY